jgi:hypothetical protein
MPPLSGRHYAVTRHSVAPGQSLPVNRLGQLSRLVTPFSHPISFTIGQKHAFATFLLIEQLIRLFSLRERPAVGE